MGLLTAQVTFDSSLISKTLQTELYMSHLVVLRLILIFFPFWGRFVIPLRFLRFYIPFG